MFLYSFWTYLVIIRWAGINTKSPPPLQTCGRLDEVPQYQLKINVLEGIVSRCII